MILSSFAVSTTTVPLIRDSQSEADGGFQRSTGIAIGVVLALFILIVGGFFGVAYYRRTSSQVPPPPPQTTVPSPDKRKKKKGSSKPGTRPVATSSAAPLSRAMSPLKNTVVPGERRWSGERSSRGELIDSLVLPELPSSPSPCLASVRPSKW